MKEQANMTISRTKLRNDLRDKGYSEEEIVSILVALHFYPYIDVED